MRQRDRAQRDTKFLMPLRNLSSLLLVVVVVGLLVYFLSTLPGGAKHCPCIITGDSHGTSIGSSL